MARFQVIAATIGCAFGCAFAGNALADEILLEREIAGMQFVQTNLQKQSEALRNNWFGISENGRNLLVREGGAVAAVSITDAGIWSFRVVGQATTSRLPTPGKATDVQRIQAVLSDPKIVDVLSLFNRARANTSTDVAVMAYQSKFDLIEKHQFENGERKYLLAVVGEQLDAEPSAVRQSLLSGSATAKIANTSLETARSRQAEEQKAILEFANGGSPSAGAVSIAHLLELSTWPESIRTLKVAGKDVTISEIPTDSGTLVLKCPGTHQQCTNEDGTVSARMGNDGIFVPRGIDVTAPPVD